MHFRACKFGSCVHCYSEMKFEPWDLCHKRSRWPGRHFFPCVFDCVSMAPPPADRPVAVCCPTFSVVCALCTIISYFSLPLIHYYISKQLLRNPRMRKLDMRYLPRILSPRPFNFIYVGVHQPGIQLDCVSSLQMCVCVCVCVCFCGISSREMKMYIFPLDADTRWPWRAGFMHDIVI